MYAWKFAYVGGNLQRAFSYTKKKCHENVEMCWTDSCSLSGVLCFFGWAWDTVGLELTSFCGLTNANGIKNFDTLYTKRPKRSNNNSNNNNGNGNDRSFVLMTYSVDVVDKRPTLPRPPLAKLLRKPNSTANTFITFYPKLTKFNLCKWVNISAYLTTFSNVHKKSWKISMSLWPLKLLFP